MDRVLGLTWKVIGSIVINVEINIKQSKIVVKNIRLVMDPLE